MLALVMEDVQAGRLDVARQGLLDARALCDSAQNQYAARAATLMLAEVAGLQGELLEAAQLYHQILTEAGDDLLDYGHALIGLATLACERNDLETAQEYVSRAIEIGKQQANDLGQQFVEEALLVPGSLVLARVLYARGETEQAQQLLQALIALTDQRRWLQLQREVRTYQVRLALATGNLLPAQRWMTTCLQPAGAPLLDQEREALLAARLRIAQGDTEAALRMLRDLRIVNDPASVVHSSIVHWSDQNGADGLAQSALHRHGQDPQRQRTPRLYGTHRPRTRTWRSTSSRTRPRLEPRPHSQRLPRTPKRHRHPGQLLGTGP